MNDRFIKKLWHTNRKIFLKEFSILQTIHSDGTVEHTYFEYKPKTQELERLSSCQIKEINCTGLKDKNGKLIYEGDIVQFPNPYELNKVFRQVIEWQELALSVGYMYTPAAAKCVEVIGNIYENKELLEGENEQ